MTARAFYLKHTPFGNRLTPLDEEEFAEMKDLLDHLKGNLYRQKDLKPAPAEEPTEYKTKEVLPRQRTRRNRQRR